MKILYENYSLYKSIAYNIQIKRQEKSIKYITSIYLLEQVKYIEESGNR
jgi:hypothetical protein